MQNKEDNKVYFWKHSDYCEQFKKDLNDVSLYEYLYYSIIEKTNPYIYSYVNTISLKDPLLDLYDITIESFIYFTDKKKLNVTMLDLKNFLSNLYRTINTDKRKIEKVDNSKVDLTSNHVDLDLKMDIIDLLSVLTDEERYLIQLYFFEGHTYDSILNICCIKTKMGVKYKIDSILKKLRDTL